ncbi:MAG: PAS domain S-box protein [Anaerolineales bacterium]|nr:PAS domain S-box protein [Anaerolineales bacterium]
MKVLYVEDDPQEVDLIRHELARHAPEIDLDTAPTLAAARASLASGAPYDLVLSDAHLPDGEGLALLAHAAALPVVVLVTGQGDEEAAQQVPRLGTIDYVVKNPGYLHGLPSILESAYHRTQLLRDQAALRQSEAKYRALVEQTPAITYIASLDESGRLQYVSPQVEATLGVHPADLLADSGLWQRQVHPADQARVQGRMQRASSQAGPVQTEFRWIRPDGRSVWLRDHACVVHGPEGEPLFLQGILLDISEGRQSEAQLAYQAHLLANINDAVLATDAAGQLSAWNRAAEALYGWKAEEVLGRLASEVTRTELSPEARGAAAEALDSTGRYTAECVQYRRDGTRLVVEGTTIALHDEAGALTGFVTVNRDISERKRAEAERDRLLQQVYEAHRGQQALSMRLLEVQEAERRHLARELHDEVGQQLTSLKLLLEMNANQPGKPVRSSLAEAQLMLQQLMDVIRELSLSLRPAMLDDLGLLPALLWHLERFTQQTGVQIQFQHSGIEGRRFPTEVETAAYRIIQEALTNVARYARAGAAQVRLWREAQDLRLEVIDHGRGFDARAAQSANRSSGLAGMRERASLLGGQVRIDSFAGRGTRLTAALPVDFNAQKRND